MEVSKHHITFDSDLEAIGYMTECFGGDVGDHIAEWLTDVRCEEHNTTDEEKEDD